MTSLGDLSKPSDDASLQTLTPISENARRGPILDRP